MASEDSVARAAPAPEPSAHASLLTGTRAALISLLPKPVQELAKAVPATVATKVLIYLVALPLGLPLLAAVYLQWLPEDGWPGRMKHAYLEQIHRGFAARASFHELEEENYRRLDFAQVVEFDRPLGKEYRVPLTLIPGQHVSLRVVSLTVEPHGENCSLAADPSMPVFRAQLGSADLWPPGAPLVETKDTTPQEFTADTEWWKSNLRAVSPGDAQEGKKRKIATTVTFKPTVEAQEASKSRPCMRSVFRGVIEVSKRIGG